MKMLSSATRISLLVLIISLPVLVWFGKVPADLYKEIILMVTAAFFAVKGASGGDTQTK